MYFDNFIDAAHKSISLTTQSNKLSASKILHLKKEISPNFIEKFVEISKKAPFSALVAGVDSGFVSKRMSFLDLILIRTSGVIFEYDNSVLKKAEYFPEINIMPQPILLKNGLEKDEEQQSVSLERLKKEVELSIEIIEKYKPKYFFIDGSIVPQYQDKPRTDSFLSSDYNSIISLFEKLYSVAQKNSTILISTIEDSRGNRFKQILNDYLISKNIKVDLSNSTDSSLLDYFLLKGERTFSFSYTKSISQHPVLKDYSLEWSKSIYAFYIKPSEFDKPLRVEFVCGDVSKLKELSGEISSIVYALSSLYKEYAYPSILIEADMRARLNERDINLVYEKLIDKLGPKMLMRRNSRPFN